MDFRSAIDFIHLTTRLCYSLSMFIILLNTMLITTIFLLISLLDLISFQLSIKTQLCDQNKWPKHDPNTDFQPHWLELSWLPWSFSSAPCENRQPTGPIGSDRADESGATKGSARWSMSAWVAGGWVAESHLPKMHPSSIPEVEIWKRHMREITIMDMWCKYGCFRVDQRKKMLHWSCKC